MAEAVRQRSEQLKEMCNINADRLGNRTVYDHPGMEPRSLRPDTINTCSHYFQKIVCTNSAAPTKGHHWGGGQGSKPVVKTLSLDATCGSHPSRCAKSIAEPHIPHNRVMYQGGGTNHPVEFGPDLRAIPRENCVQCTKIAERDKQNRARRKDEKKDKDRKKLEE